MPAMLNSLLRNSLTGLRVVVGVNRNSGLAHEAHVNGQERVWRGDPTMPSVAIDDLLGLKGNKVGCGQALCGASPSTWTAASPFVQTLCRSETAKSNTIEQYPGALRSCQWRGSRTTSSVGYAVRQIMSGSHCSSQPKLRDGRQLRDERNLCRCGTYPRFARDRNASNSLGKQ